MRDNLRANIEHGDWHGLAMRCISCGTCTYVCPNCYCFNITDEMVETRGSGPHLGQLLQPQLHAGDLGAQPPRPKSNRFRNRFSHKFWYYPDKYDSLLCSGCGRCIAHCPTRIDIREVVGHMGAPIAVETAAAAAGEEA